MGRSSRQLILFIPLLFSCLFLSSSFAANLGVYFDAEGTIHEVEIPDPPVLSTLYLVAHGFEQPGVIEGWECGITPLGPAALYGWDFVGAGINGLVDPQFRVMLNEPVPAGGALLLATVQAYIWSANEPVRLYLHPLDEPDLYPFGGPYTYPIHEPALNVDGEWVLAQQSSYYETDPVLVANEDGAPPAWDLGISPRGLALNDTYQGTVTLKNEGPVALTTEVFPEGPDLLCRYGTLPVTEASFTVHLNPQEEIALHVQVTAQDPGYQGIIRLMTSGTEDIIHVARQIGTGPWVFFEPGSLDFGHFDLEQPEPLVREFEMLNLGNGPFVFEATVDGPYSLQIDGTPLDPGEVRNGTVSFLPPGPGSYQQTILFADQMGSSDATVACSGWAGLGGMPDAPSVDFGKVGLGFPAWREITFTNIAPNPISGFIAAPGEGFQILQGSGNFIVPVGEAHVVLLQFLPEEMKTYTAVLDPGPLFEAVPLTGAGTPMTATLAAEPASMDFGAGYRNHPLRRSLVLHNGSPVPYSGQVLLDSPYFSLDGSPMVQVGAGQSVTLDLLFDAQDEGVLTGNLTLAPDVGVSVPLAGFGLGQSPLVLVQPETLHFGAVGVGAPAQRTLTVTNLGPGLLVSSAYLEDPDGAFRLDPATSHFGLPVGASHDLTVILDGEVGAHTAQLELGADTLYQPVITGVNLTDPQEVQMGMYFDPEYQVNNLQIPSGQLFTAYLVGHSEVAFSGWSVRVGQEGEGIYLLGFYLPLGSSNGLYHPEYHVQMETPVPAGVTTMLAYGQYLVFSSTDYSKFRLDPGAGSLLPGSLSFVVNDPAWPTGAPFEAVTTTGHAVVASVNAPRGAMPGEKDRADLGLPTVTRLVGAHPNPFNPRTTVQFELAEAGPVSLEVFDTRGRRVDVLAQGRWEAGAHDIVWQGLDGAGRALPSGIYFLRMQTEAGTQLEKMTLVR